MLTALVGLVLFVLLFVGQLIGLWSADFGKLVWFVLIVGYFISGAMYVFLLLYDRGRLTFAIFREATNTAFMLLLWRFLLLVGPVIALIVPESVVGPLVLIFALILDRFVSSVIFNYPIWEFRFWKEE